MQLGRFNSGFVRRRQPLKLGHQGALGINRLLRQGAGNAIIALQIGPRVGELSGILALFRQSLIKRCLQRGRINFREHLPLLDVLAFLKTHFDDLTAGLRLHRNRV